MLLNVYISNFMGIEKSVNITSIANNKIKRKNKDIIKIEDNINALKTIGIIGSNGSGKTSILNAIATVQTFITFPFRKSTNNNEAFIEQIKKLPDEILNDLLKSFNTLELPLQNVNSSKDNTIIKLDFFIPKEHNIIDGYYTYKLVYDKEYKLNGVKEECLFYRKKYNSKKIIEIFKVNNILESELGTKLLYQNNTINNDNNNMLKYYHSFGNLIMNKCEFIFQSDSINLISQLKKDKSRFVSLCNLADEKIINADIEKKDNKEILYFINNKNNKLYFEQLSSGTKKVLVLGNKILESLENNKLLFVDEIETSLHSSLAKFLVMLMQYPMKNSYSQLFFTTHSVFLPSILDNDQLYYINNKDNNYEVLNISHAIRNGIITKDKTLTVALVENLLINNPDINKIDKFINKNSSN